MYFFNARIFSCKLTKVSSLKILNKKNSDHDLFYSIYQVDILDIMVDILDIMLDILDSMVDILDIMVDILDT